MEKHVSNVPQRASIMAGPPSPFCRVGIAGRGRKTIGLAAAAPCRARHPSRRLEPREQSRQAPAPFHIVPRGGAGPSLPAMILFEKCGQHQPLNRQADRYAREAFQPADPRRPSRGMLHGAAAAARAAGGARYG